MIFVNENENENGEKRKSHCLTSNVSIHFQQRDRQVHVRTDGVVVDIVVSVKTLLNVDLLFD